MKKYQVGIVGYGWAAGAHIAAMEKNQEMPLTGLKEAILTHEVIFAAEQSLQSGRPVKMTEIG